MNYNYYIYTIQQLTQDSSIYSSVEKVDSKKKQNKKKERKFDKYKKLIYSFFLLLENF